MKLLKTVLLLISVLPLYGQRAKVFAVHDGDSYRVRFEGREVKQPIRIMGIDCPEVRSNIITKTQPYGRMVADSVRALIKTKTVTIDSVDTDLYGRVIAKVTLDSIDVAEYIVKKGWAYVSTHYTEGHKEYYDHLTRLQVEAENNRLGMWYYGDMVHPFIWRTIHRK